MPTDDDHRLRRAFSVRPSSATCSAVVPGQASWAARKSSVSHRESCPSNTRTSAADSVPVRYDSTAKPSSTARWRSAPPASRAAPIASGMVTVTVMVPNDAMSCGSRKTWFASVGHPLAGAAPLGVHLVRIGGHTNGPGPPLFLPAALQILEPLRFRHGRVTALARFDVLMATRHEGFTRRPGQV
jgi:hypothetical protein